MLPPRMPNHLSVENTKPRTVTELENFQTLTMSDWEVTGWDFVASDLMYRASLFFFSRLKNPYGFFQHFPGI
jgi:hypothetical protein